MKKSQILRFLGLTFAVAVLALTGLQLQGAEGSAPGTLICASQGIACNNDADCGAPLNPDCFCNSATRKCQSRFLLETQSQ